MDQRTIQILFLLLRSAICGEKLTDEELGYYSSECVQNLLKISNKHDVAHILVWGLKQNDLLAKDFENAEKYILKSVYHYELLKYEYETLCDSLEKAEISFIPLKGSVIRDYYPEPWMRTSCDIDILVHNEDLEKAVFYLSKNQNYVKKERTTHDVSLFAPNGVHVELHFDLVEEGRANNAIEILSSVWDNVTLCENSVFQYEMSDAFFYFYHIAHMAKHFENGGCGIRPFIDLFILDHIDGADFVKRDELLSSGGLLQFAKASRKLSRVWFGEEQGDELSEQMQDFILRGGSYGTTNNRVSVYKKQGKLKYILSRIFISYDKLRRYYPVLEKHKWLTPIMQIRRWFMMLDPSVRRMAKSELFVNSNISHDEIRNIQSLLKNIGL